MGLKTLAAHLGSCDGCGDPVYGDERRWVTMKLRGPVEVLYRWWHWHCWVPVSVQVKLSQKPYRLPQRRVFSLKERFK